MASTSTKPKMMVANQACVITVGPRPIEYQRKIVRDRHTGKLAEIDIHELPPVDEGDLGRSYVRMRGACRPRGVLDAPGYFREADG